VAEGAARYPPAHGGYYRPNGYGAGYGGHVNGPGAYYGRGPHDDAPHWHRSYTPYGAYEWYGRGPHDDVPHQHHQTPYSYRGQHWTQRGYTESSYPPAPSYYLPPW
jgi:hypothetical protein